MFSVDCIKKRNEVKLQIAYTLKRVEVKYHITHAGSPSRVVQSLEGMQLSKPM